MEASSPSATLEPLYAAVAPASPERLALEPLRRTFLTHATGGARYLDDPAWLAAYRAFFFPQTVAKVASVLRELDGLTPEIVVDLGAAMAPAALCAFAILRPKTLFASDFSAAALRDASALAKRLGAPLSTEVHDMARGWPNAAPEAADLVLACNALSELPSLEARLALCHEVLTRRLRPGGAFVIIEPADRTHARDLQTLRDALLALGHAPIRPCPHAAPCPALARARDFCHEARHVALPEWFGPLAAKAGLSDTRMRFSYLVYQGKRDEPQRPPLRIISHPIVDKGRLRYFACGAGGLVELMRQDKHRNAHNAAFDTLGRGALVRVESASAQPATAANAPQRLKLGPEDRLLIEGDADPQQSRDDDRSP